MRFVKIAVILLKIACAHAHIAVRQHNANAANMIDDFIWMVGGSQGSGVDSSANTFARAAIVNKVDLLCTFDAESVAQEKP